MREFATAYGMCAYLLRLPKGKRLGDRPWAGTVEAEQSARRAVRLGADDAVTLCQAGFALAFVVGDLNDGAALIDRAHVLNTNLATA